MVKDCGCTVQLLTVSTTVIRRWAGSAAKSCLRGILSARGFNCNVLTSTPVREADSTSSFPTKLAALLDLIKAQSLDGDSRSSDGEMRTLCQYWDVTLLNVKTNRLDPSLYVKVHVYQ